MARRQSSGIPLCPTGDFSIHEQSSGNSYVSGIHIHGNLMGFNPTFPGSSPPEYPVPQNTMYNTPFSAAATALSMIRLPADTYARSLLSHGHGYPLWTPTPFDSDPPHLLERGVDIGDVGLITSEGEFMFFFNVRYPRDHERNSQLPLPDNFRHIEIDESKIDSREHALVPGEILKTDTYLADATPNSTSPAQISLSSCSNEGAVLYLPNGARRVNTRDVKRLRDLVEECAVDWYRFVYDMMGDDEANGILYVVTGHDTTTAWANASHYSNHTPLNVSLQLDSFPLPDSEGFGCRWRPQYNARAKSWPWPNEPARPNQCVFIRGFKIAIRSSLFRGGLQDTTFLIPVNEKADPTRVFAPPTPLPPTVTFLSGNTCGGGGGSQTLQAAGEFDVIIEAIPDNSGTRLYHPLDVINEYLLRRVPGAYMAITHDDDWIHLTTKPDLPKGALCDEGFLVEAGALDDHCVVKQGIIFLRPWEEYNSDSSRSNTTSKLSSTPNLPSSDFLHSLYDKLAQMGFSQSLGGNQRLVDMSWNLSLILSNNLESLEVL